MNKEEPYREQAQRLKQRINKINEDTVDHEDLPPRGERHRKKQPKTNLKVKNPVISLLVLVFILMPVIIFCITTYVNEKRLGDAEKASETSNAGYETITIEKNSGNTGALQGKSGGAGNAADAAQPAHLQTPPALPAQTAIGGKDSDKNSSAGQTGNSGAITPSKKLVYYTVKSRDTLFKIAVKFYNSAAGEAIIKKANHLPDNQIKTGQVLKIPFNN